MKTRPILAALVLLPALALAAAPPPRIPVAVLPPAADAMNAELALLIQAKASAALGQSGRYADFHLKQLFGMAAEEGLDLASVDSEKSATVAARHLGAQRVVFGRLEGAPGAWVLKITASGGKKAESRTVKLPAGFARAVDEGGFAIAGLVASMDRVVMGLNALEVSPFTSSDEAAKAYAHCHALVVLQPIGIENPTVLREPELAAAVTSCKAAVAADPRFRAAHAALGLALAISGEDKPAVEALSKVNAKQSLDGSEMRAQLKAQARDAGLSWHDETGYEPLYWVARFWLVTRYQSNDAGVAILREAITQHPGFLMARGYLGELLNVLGRHPEALAVWSEFQAIAPASPFVVARVGKAQARMGEHAEAIAKTREAQKLDPESIELKLQLASRHIDAGELAPAIKLLEALTGSGAVRPEALVRLGFAHLGMGALDKAEPVLKKALAAAAEPGAWRTRARANYDLALWAARKGEPAQAEAFLFDSMREGYKPRELDPELKAIAAKSEAEALKAAKSAAPLKPASKLALTALPREASPFAIDASGELDLARPKPPPPQGFEILKFGK
ncbi:MAG: tetratricopeptide repeat protein [Myxococcaceae bacterium]